MRDAALAERVTSRRSDAGVQSAAEHPYNARSVTSDGLSAAKLASQHSSAEEF